MKLNRKELRKIQYDFNSCSNRLLQANYKDYSDVLAKFVKYIDSTPIISDYICDCGSCDLDIENEVKEVQGAYGKRIFSLGETDGEEIRNVYAVLKYLVENNSPIYCDIARGYSSSKWQDKIKGFNERFVMVLIRHVESYLTKVGIDMGIDEKNVYNVTVQNGQAIIANDNSSVTATTNIGVAANDIEQLIAAVRTKMDTLVSDEDKETVSESLEVIEAEVVSERPKKSMIRTAIASLQAIKGTVEFGSAVATLIQFVGPMLS